jgi:hypothetical protein
MKNSRLIIFFQQLTKKEKTIVENAVFSPYFNVRKDVTDLWEILREGKDTSSKEEIFEKIYPNIPYNDQKMRSVMSWLLSVMERALSVQVFEQNETAQKLQLTTIYRNKGLDMHFKETVQDVTTNQQKTGLQDALFYQHYYQLELEQYLYNSVNRSAELNLQNLHDVLDVSYIIEKLHQSCMLISHQAVYKKDYDTGLLEAVLQRIKDKKALLEIPAIHIYYHCYHSLKDFTQVAHFEEFRKGLLENYRLFSNNDIRDLYLMAINYCIRKHNGGNEAFALQGLELYKKGLLEGFFLENGILSRFTYRNIVTWALLFEEFDWTETFINDYKNALDRSYRDSMYSFSLARLEYSRKNYKAAMLLLQRAEYRDILLGLAAKTILMKIYYELDEWETLEAHLSSMKAYLVRKRVMGYHKTNYQNIIKYTKKLVDMANAIKGQQSESLILREAILNENILTEKEWLLAQLEYGI